MTDPAARLSALARLCLAYRAAVARGDRPRAAALDARLARLLRPAADHAGPATVWGPLAGPWEDET